MFSHQQALTLLFSTVWKEYLTHDCSKSDGEKRREEMQEAWLKLDFKHKLPAACFVPAINTT